LANLPQYPSLSKLIEDICLPEFLDQFNLDVNKPIKFLSGGQRQILAILSALQKQAQILLLDEPTAALDSNNANMVISFLTKLVEMKKITILIICHDKKLAQNYSQDGHFEMALDNRTKERFLNIVKT
jgi:putative tryptophan/tyrosine transport system ATP-binding protein